MWYGIDFPFRLQPWYCVPVPTVYDHSALTLKLYRYAFWYVQYNTYVPGRYRVYGYLDVNDLIDRARIAYDPAEADETG